MTFKPSAHLRRVLENLPTKPGVYLFKDENGEILYVGKAKKLRDRVRSYFGNARDLDQKTRRLRARVTDIQFIVVENEVKALILEETLIKRHQPTFNVLLKDDKRYPYIRVNWQDAYPTVETTRRIVRDGSRYFGPYTAMWQVQNTLRVLRRAFPYLTCDREITGRDPRACLFHDIQLCSAPCIGAIDRASYRRLISELMDVLGGRSEPVIRRLREEMTTATAALQFERAATIRDQLNAIEFITKSHVAVSPRMVNQDVIALARDKNDAVVQILFIRNGKLIGSDARQLDHTAGETDATVLHNFITQFYGGSQPVNEIPRELVLPNEIEEARILERWLSDKRNGERITLSVPQSGKKRNLIHLAQENAGEAMKVFRAQWEADATKQEDAISSLQAALALPKPPMRIECFDVSTTQGTAIVASRVVFAKGIARKSEYRRFNIRTVAHPGADDYQSMREALTRRFTRYLHVQNKSGRETIVRSISDETWKILPDLLLLDGGQGQLNIGRAVLAEFGLAELVPVVALSKQEELIHRPQSAEPLRLGPRNQGLHLLQRIRDEAHRFAISSHRRRRSKLGMESRLEQIPGIGPRRRQALLKQFGYSNEAIKQASIRELITVPGISERLAFIVKEKL
ncbi:MAG: excinuclease ABC subunit UvrC [Anaerolineaceae bacterium]|nr:excinuclease ABC subunit UvrC [Anaerolineaceae bacterium]